jgi:hypothetical protein
VRGFHWVVAVAVLSAGAGGCGEPELSGYGETVRTYALYGYPLGPTGQRTDGPKYLQTITAEIGTGKRSTEDTLKLAVTHLLDGQVPPGFDNFWAERCAPGRVVDDVEMRSDLITIRMTGEVPRHEQCVLTAAQHAVRRQQLAWTVTHHLDPFGEQKPPIVRLIEANGDQWEVVADPDYVEPHDRPTPSISPGAP